MDCRGVTKGRDGSSYKLIKNVSREAMAALMHRLSGDIATHSGNGCF